MRIGILSCLIPIVPALGIVDAPPVPSDKAWTIVQRSIGEGKGVNRSWQIDYTLRNDGETPIELHPNAIAAEVEGYVSNSRVASHACPRLSRIRVTGSSGLSASCDVLPSTDESRRCRERAVMQVWLAGLGDEPPEPVAKPTVRLVSAIEPKVATILPGGLARVRLRLEHDHFLYGPHDPLLGPRKLLLSLGGSRLDDTLLLIEEIKKPKSAKPAWPSADDPPADRLDTRYFVSAPSSLHLQAHVPGEQSHRFHECPVRYSTRMRLRYYYLIAPGTEGECKSRVAQYKDAPTAFKMLNETEQAHSVVGRWVKVERIFRTESEATSLILEFKVVGDIGEMWIDDVSLEPAEEESAGP